MRQILTMILHCLYIYILVYKFKRNLHYTCKLHKIYELQMYLHRPITYPDSGLSLKKNGLIYMQKSSSLKFEIPVCYMLTRAATLIVFNVIVLIFLFLVYFPRCFFRNFPFH